MLTIGTNDPVAAIDIIAHASRATQNHSVNGHIIIWGSISRVSQTRLGGLMLGLTGGANGIGILIDRPTLSRLHVPRQELLIGRHVIAYGKFTTPRAGNGRPYVHALEHAVAFSPHVRRYARRNDSNDRR